MGRSPCSEKLGLRVGLWTPEEDQKLLAFIEQHGHGKWSALPLKAGLQRYGKSCRLRWVNYLRPGIKRGEFSLQEEHTIIQLHALLGNRWSVIASYLPKRTDNEIKNYWNTNLKKRLTKMGIDPVTHKPYIGSKLSHMAQWEKARLEAEARLARESKPLRAAARPPCLDVLSVWQSNISSYPSCSSALSAVMALSGDHQGSPMLPINDMPYHNNVLRSPRWFDTYVGGNYVAGGEDNQGTTGMVSDDNILMHLVTINESFSGSNNFVM